MTNNNGLKKQLQDALAQHHHNSQASDAEQWFTRAAIAKQLQAPSGTLNPSRTFALNELVSEGVVEVRKQPDQKKGTLEFRLKSR